MNSMTPSTEWFDSLDLVLTLIFLTAALAVPALGYVFMVLDIRAYLRSLRRALVRVAGRYSDLPDWVRNETPYCILAFGLRLPCTEEDLKRAYRERVKHVHPDHGGDENRFRALQTQFDAALALLQRQQAGLRGPCSRARHRHGAEVQRRSRQSAAPAGAAFDS